MSVAPLEFWAVTVRLNDVPAVSAVGAARTSLSYEAVDVPSSEPTIRLAIGEPRPVT